MAQVTVNLDAAAACFDRVLGRRYAFVPAVVTKVVETLGLGKRVGVAKVYRALMACPGFQRGCSKAVFPQLQLNAIDPHEPSMQPAEGIAWSVPAIVTLGDLAHWMDMGLPQVLWLADARGWERRAADEALKNYRYRWVQKRSGGARLIESPKARLKEVQRRILRQILEPMAVHPAAHAFRKGCSTVTSAEPHVGQRMVLRMDLQNFFPSVSRARVVPLFRMAGYPESVALALANLCVNAPPAAVLSQRTFAESNVYRRPHLPQGAPTSPALANLCAYRMDARLAGLAKACGAVYTRYADDLIFSGGDRFARGVERFHLMAMTVVLEEGFQPNPRKTHFMARSDSQRVVGLVVNGKVNTGRREYDVLKAILNNCVQHGPSSQNRKKHTDFRAHLAGRIAHVAQVNEGRGRKLARTFVAIDWSDLVWCSVQKVTGIAKM